MGEPVVYSACSIFTQEAHMTVEEDGAPKKPPRSNALAENETPFDVWLKRGLQQLFGDVANEPIPEDLIALIEKDRKQ